MRARPAATAEAAPGAARRRRPLLTLLKLALTVALVAFLLARISPGAALALVGRARLAPLAAALAIFALSVVLGAWQWGRFLAALGIRLRPGELTQLYWVGLFFNNFMPGSVGGDLVKVLDLSRRARDPVAASAATLADRLTGLSALAALAMLAAAGLWADPALRPLARGILIGGTLFLLLGALFYLDPLLRLLYRLGERLSLWPAGGLRARAIEQLRRLRRQRALLLRLFALSLLVQGLRVAVHYFVGLALLGMAGPELPAYFLAVPPLAFALTLPLTLGGFGLREGLALPLFAPLGVSGEAAVAIELLAYLAMLAVSLVGGLLFLRRRRAAGAGPAGVAGPGSPGG
ncbi:flippase-like domain-containing protein [bacterium]|nr:flippase-like domain-containing protein [bacterium]